MKIPAMFGIFYANRSCTIIPKRTKKIPTNLAGILYVSKEQRLVVIVTFFQLSFQRC